MRVELEIPLSLNDILIAVKAKSSASPTAIINAVCTDTREVKKGDLFIAINGERQSAEAYIPEAIAKGCYVITQTEISGAIRVDDTVDALLAISRLYKSKLKPLHTIAITGSVGKSTTVKFLSRILSQKYAVHSPIGNFNNHIGVPITVLSSHKNTDALVLEMGMNHKKEISRLSMYTNPSIAVITSIGTAHIGNLGTREDIALAKLEIADGMTDGALLLPIGEPLLSGIEKATYVGRNSSLSRFSLDNTSDEAYNLRSPLGDIHGITFFDKREHLLYDLAFAIVSAQLMGLSKEEIINGVGTISEGDLRQRFIVSDDFLIFDDSYNASLESICADLKFICTYDRPKGAFLGDVLELGDSAALIHERIGREAAISNFDRLYLYGNFAMDTARGAIDAGMPADNIYVNTDVSAPEISIDQIKKNHLPNEIILFKASHKLRLDKIADLFKMRRDGE